MVFLFLGVAAAKVLVAGGLVAITLAGSLAAAQSQDVSFLVMGKTSNHRQSVDGSLALLNYHFFAEIFVKDGGRVEAASLSFPDGKSQRFDDLGFVQEVHGGRYDDESELDRSYPNGDYVFRFETGSGDVDGRVMAVRGTGQGSSRIPRAPRIALHQGGGRGERGRRSPRLGLDRLLGPTSRAEARTQTGSSTISSSSCSGIATGRRRSIAVGRSREPTS